MDMFWVHVGLGAIACILTGLHAYRAGRDVGIEIGKQDKDRVEHKFSRKLKILDNRIQDLKRKQDRTVTAKK